MEDNLEEAKQITFHRQMHAANPSAMTAVCQHLHRPPLSHDVQVACMCERTTDGLVQVLTDFCGTSTLYRGDAIGVDDLRRLELEHHFVDDFSILVPNLCKTARLDEPKFTEIASSPFDVITALVVYR